MSKIRSLTERQFNRKWQELIQSIREITPFKDLSDQARKDRVEKARKDPFYFYRTYLPHYFTLPSAQFHFEMNSLCEQRNKTINVFAAPRDHAKSTIPGFAYKIWQALYRKRRFIIQISDTVDIASDSHRAIKIEFEENKRILADFGKQITDGWWESDDFVIRNGCRFLALGYGGRIRGRKYRTARPDYIVLDDLENDKNVQNEFLNREKVKWVKEAVYGALDEKGTLVWLGTIMAENCALKLFIDEMRGKDNINIRIWRAIQENGTALWPERVPIEKLLKLRKLLGFSFEKEWQQNPIQEGKIFKREWIIYMTSKERDIVLKKGNGVIYIDPSFGEKKRTKKRKGSDYKAQICMFFWKGKYYIIKTRIKQESILNMVKGTYEIYEDINKIVEIRMEDNFWQAGLFKEYDKQAEIRGYNLPIRGKTNKIDKDIRIQKTAPLLERGRILFNRDDIDSHELIKQLLGYPDYDFDDAPDALSGAIELFEKKNRKIRRVKLW